MIFDTQSVTSHIRVKQILKSEVKNNVFELLTVYDRCLCHFVLEEDWGEMKLKEPETEEGGY